MNLSLIKGNFSVYRFNAHDQIPKSILAKDSFFSITKTADELSIVCETGLTADALQNESGWKLFKVEGPLAFAMVGVLTSLVQPLAALKISVFVISTYDTDYVLVKDINLDETRSVLRHEGFTILD